MNVTTEIDMFEYEGKKYFTVRQFAALTNRSEKAVYSLIRKGNSLRKLNSITLVKRTLVPEEELTEFVFTGPGKYPYADMYRFDSEGKQYPVDKHDLYSGTYGGTINDKEKETKKQRTAIGANKEIPQKKRQRKTTHE